MNRPLRSCFGSETGTCNDHPPADTMANEKAQKALALGGVSQCPVVYVQHTIGALWCFMCCTYRACEAPWQNEYAVPPYVQYSVVCTMPHGKCFLLRAASVSYLYITMGPATARSKILHSGVLCTVSYFTHTYTTCKDHAQY